MGPEESQRLSEAKKAAIRNLEIAERAAELSFEEGYDQAMEDAGRMLNDAGIAAWFICDHGSWRLKV